MEQLKEEMDIDEYTASQTTLEQIFNGFARKEEAGSHNRNFDKYSMVIKSISANQSGYISDHGKY
jgi:hypothetical protein